MPQAGSFLCFLLSVFASYKSVLTTLQSFGLLCTNSLTFAQVLYLPSFRKTQTLLLLQSSHFFFPIICFTNFGFVTFMSSSCFRIASLASADMKLLPLRQLPSLFSRVAFSTKYENVSKIYFKLRDLLTLPALRLIHTFTYCRQMESKTVWDIRVPYIFSEYNMYSPAKRTKF